MKNIKALNCIGLSFAPCPARLPPAIYQGSGQGTFCFKKSIDNNNNGI
jgi:hypothetical protein